MKFRSVSFLLCYNGVQSDLFEHDKCDDMMTNECSDVMSNTATLSFFQSMYLFTFKMLAILSKLDKIKNCIFCLLLGDGSRKV